jgi:hypothetical protein
MREVRDVTAGILDRTSLQDLLDRERPAPGGAAVQPEYQI